MASSDVPGLFLVRLFVCSTIRVWDFTRREEEDSKDVTK